MMENEGKLKESLTECDRDKEELEIQCTVLDREKEEQSQIIWCDWLLLFFDIQIVTFVKRIYIFLIS